MTISESQLAKFGRTVSILKHFSCRSFYRMIMTLLNFLYSVLSAFFEMKDENSESSVFKIVLTDFLSKHYDVNCHSSLTVKVILTNLLFWS